jgi:hypothetical protein
MDYQQPELLNRLSVCDKIVRSYPFGQTKRDLTKMYTNVMSLNNERDKALVECRRVGKTTSEYEKKQSELELALTNLESYITMAILIKPE